MRSSFVLTLAVALYFTSSASAQSRKEAVIVFKDGFFLTGVVKEERTFITDPASGQSITIPLSGGLVNLDDRVRRTYFIPGQLQEVLEKKEVNRDLINLTRYPNTARPDQILPGWQITDFPAFDVKWERSLNVNVTRPGFNKSFPMRQRIIQLTPQIMHIQSLGYNWDIFYLTRELSLADVRALLAGYVADKKEIKDWKDWDKRKLVGMFLHQAGWHEEAQQELDKLVEEYPSRKEDLASLRETIAKVLADIQVEDIDRAFKAGQHKRAQERLTQFATDKLEPLVNEKNLQLARDLRNKYDDLNTKMGQARQTLAALIKRVEPSDSKFWSDAADLILGELNLDTLPRLETFVTFGLQHLREVEANAKPSQAADEVLALAVSGWLLGNASAEPDTTSARLLARARGMVLDYQKNDNSAVRLQMLQSLFQRSNMTVEVLARIIKTAPPVNAFDKTKIDTKTVKLDIDIADSRGGSYYVKLPPDYHHHRDYPVVLYLQSARERADVTLERLGELAAQHGFILAAPLWGGPSGAAYTYTAREHAIVLDSLRDLRRRFQIDSDRVFLFGWENGADAALDIGMSHPDQFAGILSMCGVPRYYTAEHDRYLTNAQYLPVYLVEGDRNGLNGAAARWMLKDWMHGTYSALYAEYKGRGPDWYKGELPRMFDWMTHKKRFFPKKEMGRRNTTGGVGEEFRTMRECDNRFYWLTTDVIDPRCLSGPTLQVRATPPASMQASISVANKLDAKSPGQTETKAKIFTQVAIQTKGLRQVTLWLSPAMVDFTNPIRIKVNGSAIGGDRLLPPNPAVLMEDFFYNGDRQRLFYEKVELRF